MTLLLMILTFALGVALAKPAVKATAVVLDIGLKIFKVGFVCLGLWSISALILYYGFGVGA